MTELLIPEDVWRVDPLCQDDYERRVRVGRETAKELSACIVAIGRNAMPLLTNTLNLCRHVQAGFRDCKMFVYENDSTDGTDGVLDQFAAAHPWFTVRHDTLGGTDSRGFEPERTVRLAKCRNVCHDWVREHAAGTAYTIVLDLDPHHGFSPDGVFNSIAWLGILPPSHNARDAGAMASYSLWSKAGENGGRSVAGYDSWAARLNWWHDRREEVGFGWFSMLLPPVGSPPVPMNSAFGGLCVYRTQAFLAAGEQPYEGGDCEHVFLHRKMHEAGWQLYMNPGCRYVAHWQ